MLISIRAAAEPARTARMLKKLFAKMLRKAALKLSAIKSVMVSWPNVEKVVKAPAKPVTRKSFRVAETAGRIMKNCIVKPMKRQPAILTARVPYGKKEPLCFWTRSER